MNSPQPKKPNILIIMTDQHRFECLGCHGHSVVKTPNIDRLAENGLDFQRAYSQSAICMPSRLSMFTGQYLHTHRIMSNSSKADVSGLTTMPRLLKDKHGYQTAVIGKTHSGHCNDMGFDYARICAGENDGENNDYADYLDQHGFEVEWYKNGWNDQKTIREYYEYVSKIPYKHSVEAWTGDETIKYLDSIDYEKPFLLWSSFERPHPPTCVPCDNPFPYNPDDIELPPYDEKWYNKPDVKRPGCENMWNVFHTGEKRLRDAIASYFSLISMIDDQIGRIIKKLEEIDELDNTIIVFTADHGEFCGEYGQFGKNLSTFDVLYRIPMIFYWKDKTCKERIYELTELVDVMPTLFDLCRIDCPKSVQGRSLADAVRGNTLQCGTHWDANDAVFFETQFIKTVRTKTHKFSLCWKNQVAWGQLYNLDADPHELNNLYNNPAYAHIQNELTLRLIRWYIQTEQPQINGNGWGELCHS
ncbi:MAG: sulfatase-like hydrolase/transferase [Victivallaceae bacterium]|nr:sulfatase-like hydrolase/transferase [Victivallaceae bacterium]